MKMRRKGGSEREGRRGGGRRERGRRRTKSKEKLKIFCLLF